MARHLFACLLLLPAAALAADGVPFGQPFVLGVNESVVVGAQVAVGFLEVPADSRCPADVLCFWPGDAEVSLLIRPLGRDPEYFVLHTYDDFGRELDLGAWRFSLLDLAPYPATAAIPIDPATYVVTLKVDLLGPVEVAPCRWGAAKARYR